MKYPGLLRWLSPAGSDADAIRAQPLTAVVVVLDFFKNLEYVHGPRRASAFSTRCTSVLPIPWVGRTPLGRRSPDRRRLSGWSRGGLGSHEWPARRAVVMEGTRHRVLRAREYLCPVLVQRESGR